MEDSNGIISSFAIVRASVSSTSLPSATRYHASLANSSRCSSSRKHHEALLSDGVNDTDANEVAMVVTPSFVILQRVSKTKTVTAGELSFCCCLAIALCCHERFPAIPTLSSPLQPIERVASL